jgi:isoquinoline 1-oxidoreductase beta subunit
MPEVVVGEACPRANRISRRRFIGYLIAAPTLVAAADLRAAPPARASVVTVQPVDFYDLTAS